MNENATVLKATHGDPTRPLRIGDIEIPCYVLEGGRRVVAQHESQSALGMSPGGGRSGSRKLASFLGTAALKPLVSADLSARANSPIAFQAPHGGISIVGYEAGVLVDICQVVLAARREGRLRANQEHIAERAEILLAGFAKVGVVALVDEATGYEAARPAGDLAAQFRQELRTEVARVEAKFQAQLLAERTRSDAEIARVSLHRERAVQHIEINVSGSGRDLNRYRNDHVVQALVRASRARRDRTRRMFNNDPDDALRALQEKIVAAVRAENVAGREVRFGVKTVARLVRAPLRFIREALDDLLLSETITLNEKRQITVGEPAGVGA